MINPAFLCRIIMKNFLRIRDGDRFWYERYLSQEVSLELFGRFPFTKKFRKFRLGCKWNTTFWFVSLKIFWNKRNCWKDSPVFPVETSQWKICVPFTEFSFLLFLSPGPDLSRSFKRPGVPRLPRMELVANGTHSSQTEIPNGNFFVNGKRPLFLISNLLRTIILHVEL